jgi:SAM-dependent methyltransferase
MPAMTSPRIEQLARAFAEVADDYERGRPEYPPAVLDVLRERVGLGAGSAVLDLAAGTGKLTRLLTSSGARVIAVEPLAELRARIAGATPLEGTAEAIPLADGTVDVAVAGDAWHWFDGERAAAELARVVRPGGGVALLWQAPVGGTPKDAWSARVGELLGPLTHGHPGFTSDQGRGALEDHPAFDALAETSVPFTWAPSAQTYLAYLMSSSFVAALEAAERAALRERLAEALPESLEIPDATRVHAARRR